MTLNDPQLVREEYASEAGLEARRSIYAHAVGPDAREVTFRVVAALEPVDLLEVGCGPGELSERIARSLGTNVVAVDLSERMVELALERGVDARVGDVQALPFGDASFDCVVAAWMLYHVADVDLGLAEIARVLRPGGRLVAVTNSEDHLAEARAVGGVDMRGRSPFSRENAEAQLRARFAAVERHDVDGTVTFAGHGDVRRYVESLGILRRSGADVPAFQGPLRASTRVSIFVARR
ncbi:MAG: class I SAM-dependent methyltransferase [Gaiellaceae bacterium]